MISISTVLNLMGVSDQLTLLHFIPMSLHPSTCLGILVSLQEHRLWGKIKWNKEKWRSFECTEYKTEELVMSFDRFCCSWIFWCVSHLWKRPIELQICVYLPDFLFQLLYLFIYLGFGYELHIYVNSIFLTSEKIKFHICYYWCLLKLIDPFLCQFGGTVHVLCKQLNNNQFC